MNNNINICDFKIRIEKDLKLIDDEIEEIDESLNGNMAESINANNRQALGLLLIAKSKLIKAYYHL